MISEFVVTHAQVFRVFKNNLNENHATNTVSAQFYWNNRIQIQFLPLSRHQRRATFNGGQWKRGNCLEAANCMVFKRDPFLGTIHFNGAVCNKE